MDRPQDKPFTLRPDQAEFVRRAVDEGRFPTPSDVVNEALRQMEEAEQFHPAELGLTVEEIRRQIEEGAKQIERGELLDGEQVMNELDELHRAEWDARKRKRA
jgi:putative addiction module CopG family antidote